MLTRPCALLSLRVVNASTGLKESDSGMMSFVEYESEVIVEALPAIQVSICWGVQTQDSYVTFSSGSFCIEMA